MSEKLSREEILSLLDYDAKDGAFYYRERPVRPWPASNADTTFNKRFAGKQAGWKHSHGYNVINLHFDRYYAHRLVWFLENGYWANQIDHINGDPQDNRIENLRECTHSENCMNGGMWGHNTSGVKGVKFYPKKGRYMAYIKKDQKMRYLGMFDTLEEASAARKAAEVELFGEFRRNNP